MKLHTKDSDQPEQGEDVGNALLQLIEINLDIARWKFRPVYKKFTQPSSIRVIYDSDYCRIKFMFSRQRIPQHDELSIKYGRLHAPDEEPHMEWHGEKCHSWHNVIEPLRYLDGLSPVEAVEQAKVQRKSPPLVERFRQSEKGQQLFHEYPPQAVLVMHATLWQHYGERLFELFDLRKPELWEKYRMFIKEYYRLLQLKSSYGPPYENIC